jgi:hypothetical protein
MIFDSMNKRFGGCIAAALVGWYLLIPPKTCKVGLLPCTAPLSKWLKGNAFDTAAECTAQQHYNISTSAEMLARAKRSPERFDVAAIEEMNWLSLAQVCASSDDPRLAK